MNFCIISICLLLTPIGWSVQGQEPGSRLSEDERIIVAFDSLARADTL